MLKHSKGFTLTECLVTFCLVFVLSGMLLPVVIKSFIHCKSWIWGVYAFHENRLNVFVEENEKFEMFYLTNKPKAWSFVKIKTTN